jgi:large subunit ribosomal protein L29
MSSKQARELRELNDEELHRRLEEAQQDLLGVRFGLATHQTENTARLRDAKRQLARIKTLLHEREQGI